MCDYKSEEDKDEEQVKNWEMAGDGTETLFMFEELQSGECLALLSWVLI